MRGVWGLAWGIVGASLALATGAGAGERLTALDPFEIYAQGFDDLRGLVVDPHGTVFVADRAAGTVTRIAPDRSRAVVARGLRRPIGLAFDPAGRLLIAEEKAGRVVRLEVAGRPTVIVSGIKQPRWLAVREDGTLFISARRLTHEAHAEDDDDEEAEPEMILVLPPTGPLHVFADGFKGLQGLVVFTYVNPAGQTEYAFRKFGFAHNPIVPHTVVKTSRTCESCHANPRALGLGLYTSQEHPKLEEFGQPRDFRWDRIVDEAGHALQVTTVDGARPLTRQEMDRIRAAPYKLPAGAAANAAGAPR